MLNAKNIGKALVVSVVFAFLLWFGSATLFGSNVTSDELDWEKMDSMSYPEAMTYMNNHTKPMSAWERLKTHVWFVSVRPAFCAFLIGITFVGCVVLLWWVRPENET